MCRSKVAETALREKVQTLEDATRRFSSQLLVAIEPGLRRDGGLRGQMTKCRHRPVDTRPAALHRRCTLINTFSQSV